MIRVQRLLMVFFALFSACIAPSVYACTVWGSVGHANLKPGLLLVKNREINTPGLEKLIVVREHGSIAYLGLFYNVDVEDQKNYPYLSAGVNREGLVVVNNSIATIAVDDRLENESDIMKKILAKYSSTDAVLKDAKQLFRSGYPNHLLIGDSKQLLSVEIGEKGIYAIKNTREGYLFHTNHFANSNTLKKQNDSKIVYSSTYARYQLIKKLLSEKAAMHKPYTFEEYQAWSSEQSNGFENSLFRSRPYPTIATWIVSIPLKSNHQAVPSLYLRFTSPVQPYAVYQVKLNTEFWQVPTLENVHVISS